MDSPNIQHSFSPNLVLELAYVGNHGSRLVGIRDINQVDPDYRTKLPVTIVSNLGVH